ncbi:MAG TPA: hypothetical protein VIK11_02355 [Tepidiformaceae bacterium]
MPGDMRLVQIARMLAVPLPELTPASAAALIAARPADMADAIFHEAADSDDVTGSEAAREYLEARLAFFGELAPPGAAEAIRAGFRERIGAWDSSAG